MHLEKNVHTVCRIAQQIVPSSTAQQRKLAAEKTLELLAMLDLAGKISDRNIHVTSENVRQYVDRIKKN